MVIPVVGWSVGSYISNYASVRQISDPGGPLLHFSDYHDLPSLNISTSRCDLALVRSELTNSNARAQDSGPSWQMTESRVGGCPCLVVTVRRIPAPGSVAHILLALNILYEVSRIPPACFPLKILQPIPIAPSRTPTIFERHCHYRDLWIIFFSSIRRLHLMSLNYYTRYVRCIHLFVISR